MAPAARGESGPGSGKRLSSSYRTVGMVLSRKCLILQLPIALFFLACLVETSAILRINRGRFVYTLDDAYVHLAMAENIARGHYGINLEEASAPSSSILWPVLLAPFASWEIGEYVPLVINLVAAAATLSLIGKIAAMTLDGLPERGKGAKTICLVIALGLATNVVGLSFTGMEHPLQVFLAVALMWGLILERTRGIVPWWMVMAIISGPLVRFENLALAVPAVIHLAATRHIRSAAASALGLLLGLGGFAVFLHSQNLGWLPTSVLLKIPVFSDQTGQLALGEGLVVKLLSGPSILLSLGILALLVFAFSCPRDPDRPLALWAALGGLAHLFVGRFGWFARYEIYIWSVILLTVMYVYRGRLVAFLKGQTFAIPLALGAFGLLTLGQHYLVPLVQTPIGSNNIYEQHYQMHRFAAQFVREPVAVNDVGFVSYRNDNYVLDLYGLASEEALALRRSAASPEWMDVLARQHHVHVAMIYDLWFPVVPRTWTPVARMYLGRANLTPASNVVAFYVVDPGMVDRTLSQLRLFAQTLPPDVSLEFLRE